jgi:hypothetical protein
MSLRNSVSPVKFYTPGTIFPIIQVEKWERSFIWSSIKMTARFQLFLALLRTHGGVNGLDSTHIPCTGHMCMRL